MQYNFTATRCCTAISFFLTFFKILASRDCRALSDCVGGGWHYEAGRPLERYKFRLECPHPINVTIARLHGEYGPHLKGKYICTFANTSCIIDILI